ncbi:hypothetical protein Agabi119p4_1109 [Agaricus bisporus var. burnettii]|uniref:F-box domain-containing protein n=1 Tax=Agaricus bisporus var. burnettii TaxID=192524 RepID=A0A8H7KLY5_AGABI|nr:hypothetical protein Agabi119p4_1109 [Agaricus bisporus var. burnettii]
MACLPVELLDEIFSLAIAQGAISPNEASYICRRWRTFQKLLFKSVKLDPFDENILDLDEHSHLILYIEELRVVPRPGSSTRSDFYDISPYFANFLRNLHNLSSMIFCDSRIQWTDVSRKSIDAFLTVFRRDAFRSLEVSVHKPLPSWMLLQGLQLTIHHIGRIIPPPEFEKPVPNFQSSLTHLVLLGNAVQRTAEFCLQQRNLAKILLRKLTHLVLEYAETHVIFAPPMAPFVENLLIFSGSQLEALEIRVSSPCKKSISLVPSPLVITRFGRCNSSHSGASTGEPQIIATSQHPFHGVFCQQQYPGICDGLSKVFPSWFTIPITPGIIFLESR